MISVFLIEFSLYDIYKQLRAFPHDLFKPRINLWDGEKCGHQRTKRDGHSIIYEVVFLINSSNRNVSPCCPANLFQRIFKLSISLRKTEVIEAPEQIGIGTAHCFEENRKSFWA